MASPTSGLTPPGSSVYSSGSMYVGDGTWDTQDNTFLLPNLQGLPFATMRYNGMGNRFKDLPGYFSLVQAHGILAAIVFLFLVPFAILWVRFYRGGAPWQVRVHIWCQILTVLAATALVILGATAVGPERKLTNPHHGIGVAIYVLVIVQFFLGWWVYSRERRKRLLHAPLKAVIHRWLGRTTALLGLAQVPLGLTLYGAPEYLFVLYTLVVTAWVLIYFVLSWQDERDRGREYNSDYSWASGSGSRVGRRNRGRLGTLVKTAAVGAGLAALASRFRRRDDDRGSRTNSGSYTEKEEKYEDVHEGEEANWIERILGFGALAGIAYWATRLLTRKKEGSVGSDDYTEDSLDTADRLEEQQTSPAANNPLNPNPNPGPYQYPAPALAHQRSESDVSYDDYMSASPSRQGRRKGHGIRDTIAGLGAVALARNLFKKRSERKEQERIEELRRQDIEEERINRANSRRQKLTGDGFSRRTGGQDSYQTTELSTAPPPGGGGFGPIAEGAAVGAGGEEIMQQRVANSSATGGPYAAGAIGGQQQPLPGPPPGPPPPPIHGESIHESSGSEMYTSAGGSRRHRRRRAGEAAAAAGLAGGAAGLAAGEALRSRREREQSESRQASGSTGNVASPPVSVKINMRNDGGKVTLRRLTEEEAMMDRRNRRQRNRAGSNGSFSGTDNERWRRTEERERQEQEQIETERQRLQASQAKLNNPGSSFATPPPPPPPPGMGMNPNLPLPTPPPIPGGGGVGGIGSDGRGSDGIGSPGTYATDTSAYANNRRRRRAERAAAAQAKAARQQQQMSLSQSQQMGGGSRVEFE